MAVVAAAAAMKPAIYTPTSQSPCSFVRGRKTTGLFHGHSTIIERPTTELRLLILEQVGVSQTKCVSRLLRSEKVQSKALIMGSMSMSMQRDLSCTQCHSFPFRGRRGGAALITILGGAGLECCDPILITILN